MDPGVLKIILIGAFGNIALISLIIAIRTELIHKVSIGKGGLDITANKKEVKRLYDVSTTKYNQDSKILDYDEELRSFSIEKSDKLRRTLAIEFNSKILCIGTIRALSGSLRFPLYEAARRNNFKEKLRPEYSREYLDTLTNEIIEEYKTFAIEREMSYCGNNPDVKCPNLPGVDGLIDGVREKIIQNWAIPIRNKNKEICRKKIELYEKNIPEYRSLGDEVNVKIAEDCIKKNQEHIKALERKPEPGEF